MPETPPVPCHRCVCLQEAKNIEKELCNCCNMTRNKKSHYCPLLTVQSASESDTELSLAVVSDSLHSGKLVSDHHKMLFWTRKK